MQQSFPVSNAGLALATEFLRTALQAAGTGSDTERRLSIILDEICANMMRHDPSLTSEAQFSLSLSFGQQDVCMILSDPGRPFNPLTQRHKTKPKIGGHGIALVKGLASSIEYTRAEGRNRLTAIIRADDRREV